MKSRTGAARDLSDLTTPGSAVVPFDRRKRASAGDNDILQVIHHAKNVNKVLKTIRDAYQLAHVTIVIARYGKEPEKDPYVRSTYSTAWIGRYIVKRYWGVDPIMRTGFMRAIPFDWSEIDRSDPRVADFFDDAARHNVGFTGFCVPLTNKFNQRGIMTVSSNLDVTAWEQAKQRHLPAWLEIGQALHKRCVRELFGDVEPPRLSPREKEALAWVAEGKEVPDIAIITDLSEHTIRTYLKSARNKLNCGTMAQAAVKAERLGLLEADPALI